MIIVTRVHYYIVTLAELFVDYSIVIYAALSLIGHQYYYKLSLDELDGCEFVKHTTRESYKSIINLISEPILSYLRMTQRLSPLIILIRVLLIVIAILDSIR